MVKKKVAKKVVVEEEEVVVEEEVKPTARAKREGIAPYKVRPPEAAIQRRRRERANS